jgi:nicotinamide-nucleotide amidase
MRWDGATLVRVEMLAVGKELLIGRTMNSNAHWLGKRLALMGSMLKEVTTVDDDLKEIEAGLKGSLARPTDFLIVVGGLGPTPDDMTLKGISGGLGVGLRRNRAALTLIREHYARRGMAGFELTPARVKMARLPTGSVPLLNQVGTAPGVKVVAGGTTIFCLPGVPAEMKSIFRNSVEPEIKARLGRIHRSYVRMKLEGVFESALAPVLWRELRIHPGAYIKSHPRGTKEGVSRIELDIVVLGPDPKKVDSEGEAIGREMARAVTELGGKVKSVRGVRGGDEGWT